MVRIDTSKIEWADTPEVTSIELSGCSSMVEPKPSKLKTRVRFPSPAPKNSALMNVHNAVFLS